MRVQAKAMVVAVFVLHATVVMAEPEWSGNWKATFATEDGGSREAKVTLDMNAGTWTALAAHGKQDKRDACVGRALPVVLKNAGSTTVTLHIEGSKAAAACGNRKARLTGVDQRTLEGEFEDGSVVRLERQDSPG
jgi:hypothetical protein